ncbi:MAG: LacI family DNA-binding transcriptional regulator [Acidobacteria bacterium]|nr:LacI family DNA-binding transcriptional regulator [Acidobacteriota bacterium]
MALTIRDVARQAGVSVATVSRCLTGRGPVHPDTEQRIRNVAERLRYVPHAAARSLITSRTQTIALLLPDMYGEYFSEFLRGADRVARQSGHHLLVSSSHGEKELRAALGATRGRVDGIVIMCPEADVCPGPVDGAEVPLVLVNAPRAPRAVATVGVDNRRGAEAMVRHLVALGHRRIAFVRGPLGNHEANERLRGYRRAVRALGAAAAPELELPGDFGEASGYEAGRRALALHAPPQAVFAANDAMAIGVLLALREAGVPVPGSVALAGFDDVPMARYVAPPLTTVRVPIEELGACALAHVLEAIRGRVRARHEVLPTQLVVRASCGAAPGPAAKDGPRHRPAVLSGRAPGRRPRR